MTERRLAGSITSAAVQAHGRLPFAAGPAGLWLLVAGLIWLVPAWYDRRALVMLALWDVAVLMAIAVDLRRLPLPQALTVRRQWGGVLTLGEPATVSIDLHAAHGTPAEVSVTDFVPAALRDEVATLRLVPLPGAGSWRASYEVRPRERGDAAVAGVAVTWQSAWRLAERRGMASLDQTVRVYPDRTDGRRDSLYLVRSRQLEIEKRRARYAGLGREFESLRDHQPGDEPRDTCWTASARRGRLVTKVYQPERSQSVWILVDAGRLSRARAHEHTILDRAVTGALAVAQVAIASGDKAGLLAYGRRIQQRVAPGRGGPHLRRLLEALADVRGEAVEADHVAAAAVLMRAQKRRALVIWLTEIAETAGIPDVIEQAAALLPRHVVLFAVPRHPAMIESAGEVPQDAGRMYRAMAAQEALARREVLLHNVRQRGALVVEVSPAELGGALVDRYLEVKSRGML